MIVYFICALRNLGRKKLRTILTASGIAIGVASVIITGAIGEGGKIAVSNELDSLGINGLNISSKTSSTSSGQAIIDDEDVKTCLSVNGVKDAMPMIMQSGYAYLHDTESSALYLGVGSNAANLISINIKHGNMFTKNDINNHSFVCLVDDTFAKKFYKRSNVTGEKIKVYLGDSYKFLTIRGVVASGSSILYTLAGSYIPYFIYVPYTTAADLRGVSGYDEIAIKTVTNNDIDKVGDHIVGVLSSTNGQNTYTASNMFKQKQRLAELLNIVTLIISAVGAISLVVAGLGIMTVMTVSVSERTREVGIKKALGAKKHVILGEFLFEALVISFFGCMIGILTGMGLSYLASRILNFSFGVRIQSVLVSTGFAIAIGVLFGVYPAVKAARLKPVEALRYE